jgi:thymidylate synthase
MENYLKALSYVMDYGVDRPDRTGVGTRAVFGMQMRYQMKDGFPVLTTKKLAFESIKAELLWFLQGSSDLKELHRLGSHIWDANAAAPYWRGKARFEGDVGRIYGVQWRDWRSPEGKKIDQLSWVIEKIKNNPSDRRLIVSAWNPGELDKMVLPPCHILFQFFVVEKTLSLQMYQRSGDMFLGVPFNIASYSLLLHMVAQVTGLQPREFIHVLGDTHVYHNHFEQVKEQLQRKPFPLPKLWLNPDCRELSDFKMEDIKLIDYRHHPTIKAPMAV